MYVSSSSWQGFPSWSPTSDKTEDTPTIAILNGGGLFCKMFDKIIIIQRYASPFIIHFYVHKKKTVKIHVYTIADYYDITK